MPDAPIRLILVEDHEIVLRGLENLFGLTGQFVVVASCRNAESALRAIRSTPADVIVLDHRLPDRTGLDVVRVITSEALAIRTVILTAMIAEAEIIDALDLGVGGLVLKESSPDDLMECVRKVHAGEQWIDRAAMTRALLWARRQDANRREATRLLTPREIEIARLVAEGCRNRTIAERLAISEGTVKIHLHNVYEKIGIDGRLELMVWVREKSLD